MGYIEKIMGDNERTIHRAHQHLLLFLGDTFRLILAFLFFLALGIAFFLSPDTEPARNVRFVIWLIGLCSLVLPIFLVVRPWFRGHRGRDLLKAIWLPILAGLVVLTLALLMAFASGFRSGGWIAIGIAGIPLGMFCYEFFQWLNRRYLVTNRRVLKVRGIVEKHVYDYALEKVNDLKLDQTFWGRLLRWGELEILTAADLDYLEQEFADDPEGFRDAYSDRYIWHISNPVRFKHELLNAKEQLHLGMPAIARQEGVSIAPAAPSSDQEPGRPAPVQTASIPDLIEELDELRRRGLLTDKEFRAKKKELLDRM